MRKLWNSICSVVVLTGGLTVLGSPALAAGVAVSHTPLSVTTSAGSTCASIPVTWYAAVPAGIDYWVVEADVLNSAGVSVDEVFELEEPPITQTSSTLSICNLAGPGTYTFRLYGQLRAEFEAGSALIDETFTVTVPAPVVTPPPPPITSVTTLRLEKNVWFQRSTYARFGGSVELDYSCPTTYCDGPARKIAIQALSGGKWRTIYSKGGITYSAYLKVRVPTKYTKIRATVDAVSSSGDTFTADTSRALRVPIR